MSISPLLITFRHCWKATDDAAVSLGPPCVFRNGSSNVMFVTLVSKRVKDGTLRFPTTCRLFPGMWHVNYLGCCTLHQAAPRRGEILLGLSTLGRLLADSVSLTLEGQLATVQLLQSTLSGIGRPKYLRNGASPIFAKQACWSAHLTQTKST